VSVETVIAGLDEAVDDFAKRTRFFKEEMTPARAKMFVTQHRHNSRNRNSVLKLRVATNCPIWDIKLDIIHACTQEIISDDEYFGGKAHWQVLEDLGVRIGMDRDVIRNAPLAPTTQMAWHAWSGLMSNAHWLIGLIANTCAERANIPGYGEGVMKEKGWFGMEQQRWKAIFPDLTDEELTFFEAHGEADLEHSDLGWKTVADYAVDLALEDDVVTACHDNLVVWEHYLNGIGDAGDAAG
jgi:pyrroloquinoline quinone (PQQ) biosynthesis protein C